MRVTWTRSARGEVGLDAAPRSAARRLAAVVDGAHGPLDTRTPDGLHSQDDASTPGRNDPREPWSRYIQHALAEGGLGAIRSSFGVLGRLGPKSQLPVRIRDVSRADAEALIAAIETRWLSGTDAAAALAERWSERGGPVYRWHVRDAHLVEQLCRAGLDGEHQYLRHTVPVSAVRKAEVFVGGRWQLAGFMSEESGAGYDRVAYLHINAMHRPSVAELALILNGTYRRRVRGDQHDRLTGVGSLLIADAIARASEAAKDLHLRATRSSRGFYEKLGFRAAEERSWRSRFEAEVELLLPRERMEATLERIAARYGR